MLTTQLKTFILTLYLFIPQVPILLLISEARSYQVPVHFTKRVPAASPAQVKFAIENKYDNTGPGSKEPDNAYHTYKYFDDALVAYLDDPDTKLPPHEKARGLDRLYQLQRFRQGFDEHVKPINMYSGMTQKTLPLVLKRYNKLLYDNPKKAFLSVVDLRDLHANDAGAVKSLSSVDPYKWQKEQEPKKIPLTINVYNKGEEVLTPNPEYFFTFDLVSITLSILSLILSFSGEGASDLAAARWS